MISKITTYLFLILITLFYTYAIYVFGLAISGVVITDKVLLPAIYQWML